MVADGAAPEGPVTRPGGPVVVAAADCVPRVPDAPRVPEVPEVPDVPEVVDVPEGVDAELPVARVAVAALCAATVGGAMVVWAKLFWGECVEFCRDCMTMPPPTAWAPAEMSKYRASGESVDADTPMLGRPSASKPSVNTQPAAMPAPAVSNKPVRAVSPTSVLCAKKAERSVSLLRM